MITWVGNEVSAMKRAKMSTDKALVKNILTVSWFCTFFGNQIGWWPRMFRCLQNFAIELTLESKAEVDEQSFLIELNKAAGANYGTGIRN